MESIELAGIERRVRVAYELGRAKQALAGALPLLLTAALTALIGPRPASALWLGGLTFGLSVLLLWYGRDAQRAVLPGFLAGLVPLGLALFANGAHHCGVHGCSAWCVPACTLGGLVAGLTVASVGNVLRAGAAFWVSGSVIALLTGAMGCACAGYAGVMGMGVGFGAGLVPGGLRKVFGTRTTPGA